MKKMLYLLISIGCTLGAQSNANAESTQPSGNIYKIEISDGSVIYVNPSKSTLEVKPWGYDLKLPIDWSAIQEIKPAKQKDDIIISLKNGDQITGIWANETLLANSVIGDLRIPTEQIKHLLRQAGSSPINIALGKPVSGQDGASHGIGLAKHVTDGDTKTHAKPPAFNFDYTIALSKKGENGYKVGSVKIHWGRFGDRFIGIRSSNGKGWASGSWPAEYVTSYQLQYRTTGSNEWKVCHTRTGRPVDEKVDNVSVQRFPTKLAGCSSESITTISNLNLDNVVAMRIQAKGQHWIGLYELEIFSN